MIYETHTHFDDKAFDDDRDEAIQKAMAAGVGCFVNIGASMESSRASVELSNRYEQFRAAVGVHPEETADLTEKDMDTLAQYAAQSDTVAIGEIGLDYYWDEPARDIQKKWFERQIDLAKSVKLPVVVHSREAAKDTVDMLRSNSASDVGGVIHCFSYSTEVAKECLDMGFYIGVGGVITFKNARKLVEVVEYAPLDMILTETDSPYLAPVPHRGKRNSSEYLPYIIKEISRIKGISEEETIRITYNNAIRLFGK